MFEKIKRGWYRAKVNASITEYYGMEEALADNACERHKYLIYLHYACGFHPKTSAEYVFTLHTALLELEQKMVDYSVMEALEKAFFAQAIDDKIKIHEKEEAALRLGALRRLPEDVRIEIVAVNNQAVLDECMRSLES